MAKLVGSAAGLGMLVLIGVLLFAFLRQIGAMRQETARQIGRTAAAVLFAACMEWLTAALIFRVTHGNLESAADLTVIFHGPSFRQMHSALQDPAAVSWPIRLLAYPGHALGKALFDQYLLGGVVLALILAVCGACLITARVNRILGRSWAEDGLLLLICLPCTPLVLLPGWASWAAFLASLLFYFLGKRIRARTIRPLSRSLLAGLISLGAMLSCAVISGMTYGWIG